MKLVKKATAVFLALVLVLGSVSVLATATLNDGLKRTIEYQFKFFDEDGNETTKVYAGETIYARLYMESDFVAGAHTLYILYDKTLMTTNEVYMQTLTSNPEAYRVGSYVSSVNGTDQTSMDLVKYGYLPADTFDTYGAIAILGKSGRFNFFDIDQWVYEWEFTINEDVEVGDSACMFIPASATITYDDATANAINSIARFEDDGMAGSAYTVEGSKQSYDWAEEFQITSVSNAETLELAASQDDDASTIAQNSTVTFNGTQYSVNYVSVTDLVKVTYSVPYAYYDVDDPRSEVKWQNATYDSAEVKRVKYYYNFRQDKDYEVSALRGTVPETPTDGGFIQDIPDGYYFAGWVPFDMYSDGIFDPDTADTASLNPATYDDTVEGNCYTYPSATTAGTVTSPDPVSTETGYVADPASASMKSLTESNYGDWIYEYQGEYYLELIALILPLPAVEYNIYYADLNGYYSFDPDETGSKIIGKNKQVVFEDLEIDVPTGFEVDYTADHTPSNIITEADGSGVYDVYFARVQRVATFNPDGGVLDGNAAPRVFYGASIPVPSATKEGHTFTGWETADGKTPEDFGGIMPEYNLEFTAQWDVNKYKITYDLDGGEAEGAVDGKVVAEYDYDATTNPAPVPTKTGYTFAGWDTATPATMPANDIPIKALWNINEYTITYTMGNGDEDVVQTYEYNSATGAAPAAPEWEGYTFTGWSATAPATMPAENITINAKWVVNNYTITYVLGNGQAPVVQTYEYNSATGAAPAAPEWEGYTFNGWSMTAPATMPARDIEIVANWTVNNYTVTYVLGNGQAPVVQTYEYNSATGAAPADPEWEGYTFTGWSATAPATMPARDVTIEATWSLNSYTLTYKLNNGEDDVVSTVNYGAALTAPTEPTWVGHTFTGWDAETPATMPARDVTIEATWSINNYKVTYYVDGEKYYEDSYDYGKAVNKLADAIKPGYTFSGWSDIPETMPATDVTVNGTFSINTYTATYILDNGEDNIEIDVVYNETIDTPEEPEKTGYTFAGWEYDETVYTTEDIQAMNMPAGDISLTAQWTINKYIITYILNNGEDNIEKHYNYNEETEAAPVVTKTGYTFASWTAETPANMPAEDLEITAIWNINEYTITYILNNGEDNIVKTYDYNEETEAAPEVTKTGYSFNGWSAATPANMPAENLEITAQWTINAYAITFDPNGGEFEEGVNSTVVKNYAEDVVFTDIPVLEGYKFAGWDTEIPATMPAENMTIKATWEVETYNISFINEGTPVGDTLVYTFGKTYTDVPTAEKTGNTFTGWQYTIDGVDYFVEAGSSFTVPDLGEKGDAVVFYAQFEKNEYDITYTADGEDIETIPVIFGEALDTPEDPEKTGYTFTGWVYTDAEGNVYEGTTMPAYALTATAQFEANEASVQFNANNGVEADNATYGAFYDDTIADVIAANSPAEPVREGYTFEGWSRSATATTADADLGKVDSDTAPVVIYAAWAINSYNITYKAKGQDDEKIPVVYGYSIVTPGTDPVKSGYTFKGWEIDGTTYTVAEVNAMNMPANDLTATAVFEADDQIITFSANGGKFSNGSATITKSIATDEPIDTSDVEEPTWAGYIFDGWDVADDATVPVGGTEITAKWIAGTSEYKVITTVEDTDGNPVEGEPVVYTGTTDSTATITPEVPEGFTLAADSVTEGVITNDGELVLTVYFTRNKYTVTFNADGGVIDGNAAPEVYYGAEIPVPAASRTGYAFAGWDADIPAAMPAENLEFTALWAANTIVVKYYNGDEIVGIDTVDYDTQYTVLEIVLGDEKVTEWTINGETVAAGEAITVNTTSVIKAVAKTIVPAGDKHTAAFVVDGETVSAEQYDVGAAIVAPADPTKTGATFLGWDKEVGTMGDEDITFTAIFAANTATVTFKSDDVEIEKIEITVGEAIDTPDVEKTGNTLLGWDIDGDGVADELGAMPAEGFTANAVWKVNEYTITYIADGAEPEEIEVAYGADLDTPEDPEKTGYAFTGWAYADAEGNAYTGTKMPAYELTATAKFDAITVKVTYVLNGNVVASDVATFDSEYTVLGYSDGVYNITKWSYNDAEYNEGDTFVSDATAPIVFTASTADDEHTLTLLANEGTFEDNTDTYEISLKEGDVIADLPTPVREGYTFTGWENLPDTMPYADVTATATWEINTYTVTYKIIYTKNNEVDAEKAVEDYTTVDTQAYGSTLDLPEVPEIEKYDFLGWYTEYSADSKVTASDATQVTGDMTVYAVMNLGLVPVTFVVDGEEVKTIEVVPGSALADTDFPADPEKTYYNFAGWFDAAEGGNEMTAGSTVSQEMTVYAQFTRYAVKLVPVEGSTAMIERDGVVESYNEGYSVNYDAYDEPENFETYFVYGLEMAMTAEKLENYVTVYGDGYYVVDTSLSNGAYGTGAVIKVYDRNGSESPIDDVLVEQLYIVIYGDLDGDSRITATDSAFMDSETFSRKWSMGEGYLSYMLKAADLDHDSRISATDSALEDNAVLINGRCVNQIKGTAYTE